VIEEAMMDGVQAEVLVNGGGLQRILVLGNGLVVLIEEGAVKRTKADLARGVALKGLPML
jgi:hypothetical protein